MNEDKDPRIEKLESTFDDLKSDLSMLRKKGKDVLIAELRLGFLPGKIKLAQATLDDKDFENAKKIINEVNKEFDELGLRDLKKEENPGQNLDFIKHKCEQALNAIEKQNKEMAREIYSQIQKAFNNLDDDEKKEVFDKCVEVAKKLK